MAGYEAIGNKTHIQGHTSGAYLAMNNNPKIKKPEENPLSNANLPGGLFTHPGVNTNVC